MSKKEKAIAHIETMCKECNAIVTKYNDDIKKCATKEGRKALRKQTRIAKVQRTLKTCVAMRELLAHVDTLEQCAKAYDYIINITYVAQEREVFIICKDDDIMSLLMRYDNFSMKKVVTYCEKHGIKLDTKTKTFDFSQCDDSVLDTFDDASDDE